MTKVWCFNCFGICIARMSVDKIKEWNEKHSLFNEKIISWKE